MRFEKVFTLANNLVQAMSATFDRVTLEIALGDAGPVIGDWSDPANWGLLVTGDGVGCKSGVYLFGSRVAARGKP